MTWLAAHGSQLLARSLGALKFGFFPVGDDATRSTFFLRQVPGSLPIASFCFLPSIEMIRLLDHLSR